MFLRHALRWASGPIKGVVMKRVCEPQGDSVERFFLFQESRCISLIICRYLTRAEGSRDIRKGSEGKEEAQGRQERELSLFWKISFKKMVISEDNTPHLGCDLSSGNQQGIPLPTSSLRSFQRCPWYWSHMPVVPHAVLKPTSPVHYIPFSFIY